MAAARQLAGRPEEEEEEEGKASKAVTSSLPKDSSALLGPAGGEGQGRGAELGGRGSAIQSV